MRMRSRVQKARWRCVMGEALASHGRPDVLSVHIKSVLSREFCGKILTYQSIVYCIQLRVDASVVVSEGPAYQLIYSGEVRLGNLITMCTYMISA